MKDASRKVYFARCVNHRGQPIGAYKIGCSSDHIGRMRSVANTLPFSLELVAVTPGSLMMEAACHLRLREHRVGGEYFSDADEVEKFVRRVAETGNAFYYIKDSAGDHHRLEQSDLLTPFMEYHGVTLKEACLRMGTTVDRYEKLKSFGKNRRLIAAAALVAASREQYVNWPIDVILGLKGERAVSHARRPTPVLVPAQPAAERAA